MLGNALDFPLCKDQVIFHCISSTTIYWETFRLFPPFWLLWIMDCECGCSYLAYIILIIITTLCSIDHVAGINEIYPLTLSNFIPSLWVRNHYHPYFTNVEMERCKTLTCVRKPAPGVETGFRTPVWLSSLHAVLCASGWADCGMFWHTVPDGRNR